ncbi:hypothetical protein B0T18DRAFT_431759 [Schizothecium vesticola]|uniref:Uncharacterized protein n=1 Tax=Schizothecium vesticola TaxID=314040 RepID=A0AA40EJE3_9PEZI|nr:hypothetical protein B0T18DRAFT_431759 [Schizothecium vesticola]
MEELSRPAPVVTGANLNIANPQRRTGDDDVLHHYDTGAHIAEGKAAVTTTTTTITPPPAPAAPPIQHKWLLWTLFVLRCISLVLLLLVFICLIYGSSRGRHYIPAYIFVALIIAATAFTQWLSARLLFPRGRVPFPPRRSHIVLVGVVEILLVGLAVAAVIFNYSVDTGNHHAECYGWSSLVEGPEARERYEARRRNFACVYTAVWVAAMLGVVLVHFVLVALTFVQACITRKVVVHPDVVLVGQQPRSGRYV